MCPADGPTLDGNTFSVIRPKLNSSAAQIELILLGSKMERSSKDLTEVWEPKTLTLLNLSSRHPTEGSSNNQINKSTKDGSRSSTTPTSDLKKEEYQGDHLIQWAGGLHQRGDFNKRRDNLGQWTEVLFHH